MNYIESKTKSLFIDGEKIDLVRLINSNLLQSVTEISLRITPFSKQSLLYQLLTEILKAKSELYKFDQVRFTLVLDLFDYDMNGE